MTDQEILIWYESLESATCNADLPESAITVYVRDLLSEHSTELKAQFAAVMEKAAAAISEAFQRREPTTGKWLSQFEVAREALRALIPTDYAAALAERIQEARYKSTSFSHGCYFCGKQGTGKDRHLILLCDEHRDILSAVAEQIQEAKKVTWEHVFQGIKEPCGCENHRKLCTALDERVRKAVAEKETQIHQLEKELKSWRSEFHMWRSAWLREIGGVIRNKHYEIDGFVLRTRDIYEKAQRFDRMDKDLIGRAAACKTCHGTGRVEAPNAQFTNRCPDCAAVGPPETLPMSTA